MIITARKTITENPIQQIWKYLRFFQHVPSVSARIRTIHKLGERDQVANVKKQATQIGYCVRQAEQYFNAAVAVGNATKPNLLYYGAVSLSQALVLLRNDGTFSLDVQRKQKKHNHHGLELERGKAESAKGHLGIESFLDSIACSCFMKDGLPWGHFPLFYKSLVPAVHTIHQRIHEAGKPSFLERDITQACANLKPLDDICAQPFELTSLMRQLPDMYPVLQEAGISADLCRGSINCLTVPEFKPVPLNDINDAYPGEHALRREVVKSTQTFQYFCNEISEPQKQHLLNFYSGVNPDIRVVNNFAGSLHLALTIERIANDTPSLYLPDVTEDVKGTHFYILKPESYLPEPASLLIALFCFGMLSRYYPDVWMRALDDNIQVAEFIDSFLTVATRKFPNLILDQLTETKHNIVLQ